MFDTDVQARWSTYSLRLCERPHLALIIFDFNTSQSGRLRYFGRYVVAGFGAAVEQGAEIDPFFVGQAYLHKPLPRDLSAMIKEVESELQSDQT